MEKHSNFSRAMEPESILKNKAIVINRAHEVPQLRKIGFFVLTTIVIFIFYVFCSATVMAQTPISLEEYQKKAQVLDSKIAKSFKKKDYETGKKANLEVIALFEQLSKEDQGDYKWLQGSYYYNLACFYSLKKQTKEAVDAFERAVNEYEWVDYTHSKQDLDLDYIRTDERFIALMEKIREKSDYLFILRQAGAYQQDKSADLPVFSYEAATSNNLKEVKDFFQLESIAGSGDEISKIINLMTWVHDNMRHDGSNYALCEFTSIDIYNYHKSTGKGINCRHLAIALNEMYLAMGFKSRYVTCHPKNENDQDCHVINCVWVNSLQKWIWIDPTFAAYVKDENGILLSINEVRERLLDGRPLVLNEDANWNHQNKQSKEYYLDSYMAKNLYWIQVPVNSIFNPESRYRNNVNEYISLFPVGYTRSKMRNVGTITHDHEYFWQKPK